MSIAKKEKEKEKALALKPRLGKKKQQTAPAPAETLPDFPDEGIDEPEPEPEPKPEPEPEGALSASSAPTAMGSGDAMGVSEATTLLQTAIAALTVILHSPLGCFCSTMDPGRRTESLETLLPLHTSTCHYIIAARALAKISTWRQ